MSNKACSYSLSPFVPLPPRPLVPLEPIQGRSRAAMSNMLQGKTVLITGASRGVGATLACALARQGASKLILVSEESSQDELHQVPAALGTQTLAGSVVPAASAA